MTLGEYSKLCGTLETWKFATLEELKWVLACTEMYGSQEDIEEAKAHVEWKEAHNYRRCL